MGALVRETFGRPDLKETEASTGRFLASQRLTEPQPELELPGTDLRGGVGGAVCGPDGARPGP